jgi:hypothetical protein
VLDRNLRRAAARRSSKPGLPYNPRNPYDTPFPSDAGPDNASDQSQQAAFDPMIGQDTRDDEDSQSMPGSELSSRQAPPPQSMPPPSIPPSSRRRHRSQLSTENIEAEAHVERMESMRTRIETLRQAKELAELEKEQMALENDLKAMGAWKGKITER